MTPLPQPADVLPHRGEAMLIERILMVEPDRLEALATPVGVLLPAAGPGGTPAWAGIELMAQAVAALSGTWDRAAGKPVGIGFLLGTRRYRSAVPALAPDRSYRVVAAVSTAGEDGFGVFDCEIWDGERRVADAALTVFRPPDLAAYLAETSR